MLVQVPVVPVPVKSTANVLGKEVEVGPKACVVVIMWENQNNLLTPGSLAQLLLLWSFAGMNQQLLCLSLSL